MYGYDPDIGASTIKGANITIGNGCYMGDVLMSGGAYLRIGNGTRIRNAYMNALNDQPATAPLTTSASPEAARAG
jgi:hypothetical protein